MTKKGFPVIKHLSSNDPIIYTMQALIIATLTLVVSFVLYLALFGKTTKVAIAPSVNSESAIIDLSEKSLQTDGIDESMFYENKTPQEIPPEKLNQLFPDVK